MERGISMNKDLYHPYVNDDGKLVSGTASLNHYIRIVGGLQKYHDEIGEAYIKAFVEHQSEVINAELARQAKKDKFKVVS